MGFTPVSNYSKNKTSGVFTDGTNEQRGEYSYSLGSDWTPSSFDKDRTSVLLTNGNNEQRAIAIYSLGSESGGGGAVDSVNGKTGQVVLTGEDISADVSELTDTVQGHLQTLHNNIKDIELFKFPFATIVGKPVIDHGQVSGFTENDYLQFPWIVDLQDKSFQIDFCFTTGDDISGQQNILDSKFGLALAIKDGKGLMAISHNGTSWAGSVSGTMNIAPNTTYYARLSWNRINYQTQLSTDGEIYTPDMNFGSTQSPFATTMFIGGCSGTAIGHTPHPFLGTINLNYAYLTVEGNVIWQGMDDAGLATRMDVDASNITEVGKERIKSFVGGLPDQTGQSGKFLTTDGTDASWGTISALQNTATNQSTNLIVDGTSTPYSPAGNYNVVFGKEFQFSRGIIFGSYISHDGSTPIGYGNIVLGTFKTLRDNTSECVVIGSNGSVYGTGTIAIGTYAGTVTNHKCDYSIAIGNKAYCDGSYGCIQIGAGTNTEPQTLKVGFASNYGYAQYEYKLLDSDGTIPEARLADTTNAAQGMVLTLDSNLNAVWQAGGSGGGSVPTLTWYTVDTAGNMLTIADTSSAQLVKVYKNGLLLQPTEDYSISGTTLTTTTALIVGDKITTEVF